MTVQSFRDLDVWELAMELAAKSNFPVSDSRTPVPEPRSPVWIFSLKLLR